MKLYVLGFLFSHDLREVLLIRKNRPEWQAGKMNGIGGKIEVDDIDKQKAMTREFHEEAGLWIEEWRLFASMYGADAMSEDDGDRGWRVFCYCAVGDLAKCSTRTDEHVVIVRVADLCLYEQTHDKPQEIVENISWMIPLAREKLRCGSPHNSTIVYN
jgi:8-oxo-dGTP diphosphatase